MESYDKDTRQLSQLVAFLGDQTIRYRELWVCFVVDFLTCRNFWKTRLLSMGSSQLISIGRKIKTYSSYCSLQRPHGVKRAAVDPKQSSVSVWIYLLVHTTWYNSDLIKSIVPTTLSLDCLLSVLPRRPKGHCIGDRDRWPLPTDPSDSCRPLDKRGVNYLLHWHGLF